MDVDKESNDAHIDRGVLKFTWTERGCKDTVGNLSFVIVSSLDLYIGKVYVRMDGT